ncbi:uncharacterized protein LOC134836685 isoform X3 [Culicoides brevitarsis]|uniref:uncharacterized protein LOC134836685 isoform X3 n=1 Tax=Culicoides brevitarsis TaxID=469753 RepID=UPI00307C8039
MKLLLASALCFLFAISFATPFVAAASQEIDVDDLINKLQQWRQNYNEGYEPDMAPPYLQRYQRANSQYQPLPYRRYFFGERSHRSLDSLGGGNLLKRSLPTQ